MRTLVIADLHNRWRWVEPLMERVRPDRTVFLGDAPDSPGDRLSRTQRTADFVRRMVSRDDVVYLIGNHEAHYLFPPLEPAHCRGWPTAGGWKFHKQQIYRRTLSPFLRRMKFAHYEQGWLLSHAGFRPGLMHPVYGLDPAWVESESQRVLEHSLSSPHPWTTPGRARGGAAGDLGGVIWLDWDAEFEPIPGTNQIVGHTRGNVPRKKVGPESINWNLDTGGRDYGLLEDGVLTLHEVPRDLVALPI